MQNLIKNIHNIHNIWKYSKKPFFKWGICTTVGCSMLLCSYNVLAANRDNISIPITQWCTDPESVNQIIHNFERPSKQTLIDYGCHWVPSFLPIEGLVEEIVNEYYIFGKFFYLVKVKLVGNFENSIGYTLIKGKNSLKR